jgi:hypothetical protein
MLVLTLPNGIRPCVAASSGRHSDPFNVTEQLLNKLRIINLPILCDAIFGGSDYVRPMERPSQQTVHDNVNKAVASIRIIAEWNFDSIVENFPIVDAADKLKLFQTNPLAVLKMAVLLSNFRCCFRGENATKYMHMLPPTFKRYVEGEVVRV